MGELVSSWNIAFDTHSTTLSATATSSSCGAQGMAHLVLGTLHVPLVTLRSAWNAKIHHSMHLAYVGTHIYYFVCYI